VNPLRALLNALTREADEHAARARDVAVSLKGLRADVGAMHREIAAVAARAAAVSRQVAQVRRLHDGGRDLPAVLDGLASVLDADRVGAHARAAVERAACQQHPSPRLAIETLWPADVYAALTRALPDPVFFDGPTSGAQTLRVPPRLAPVVAIATWTFAARIVEDVVVPAVAARFGTAPGALDVAPGRLVRRPAGSSVPALAVKPWQQGVIVIELAAPQDAETANTAVAILSAAADSPPAPGTGVRHTYEVWFGAEPA
jgi:hypothetical protein